MRVIFDRVLDGAAHEPLGACGRHGLDADAGIFADFLRRAGEHFVVEEVDQLFSFGSAGAPFDSRVHVFGVFAKDDHVHALGIRDGRGHAVEIAHRADAGVEIEHLAQRDVERTNAAAHGRGERAFDSDAKIAEGVDGILAGATL